MFSFSTKQNSNPLGHSAQSQPAQGASRINPELGAPKIPGLKGPRLIGLNCLAVIDATASSGPFSAGIVSLASTFSARLSAAIGVVNFGLTLSRDLDYDDDAIYHALHRASQAEFDRAVTQIQFAGGGDADETFLDALQACVRTYPWSYEAGYRRALIFLGSSSSKCARDGATVTDAAMELRNAGIRTFVVATPGSNMMAIAGLAGGIAFELSNNPDQREVELVCSKLTASVTQSVLGMGSGTLGGSRIG